MKKFYDPEDVPQGRYCTTCERFIQDDGLVFVKDFSRGRAMVLDEKTGTVHTLLNDKESDVKRKKRYPVKPPPVETFVYATVPSTTSPDNPAIVRIETAQPGEPLAAQPDVVSGSDTMGSDVPLPAESETPDDWALWYPTENDWYEAIIKTISPGFMFLTLTNGDEVFTPNSRVQFPSGHHCKVQSGDVVSVRVEPNANTSSAQWSALEVVIQTQHDVPQEPETGNILWWGKKSTGWW
jgi:hypothetical protein